MHVLRSRLDTWREINFDGWSRDWQIEDAVHDLSVHIKVAAWPGPRDRGPIANDQWVRKTIAIQTFVLDNLLENPRRRDHAAQELVGLFTDLVKVVEEEIVARRTKRPAPSRAKASFLKNRDMDKLNSVWVAPIGPSDPRRLN